MHVHPLRNDACHLHSPVVDTNVRRNNGQAIILMDASWCEQRGSLSLHANSRHSKQMNALPQWEQCMAFAARELGLWLMKMAELKEGIHHVSFSWDSSISNHRYTTREYLSYMETTRDGSLGQNMQLNARKWLSTLRQNWDHPEICTVRQPKWPYQNEIYIAKFQYDAAQGKTIYQARLSLEMRNEWICNQSSLSEDEIRSVMLQMIEPYGGSEEWAGHLNEIMVHNRMHQNSPLEACPLSKISTSKCRFTILRARPHDPAYNA